MHLMNLLIKTGARNRSCPGSRISARFATIEERKDLWGYRRHPMKWSKSRDVRFQTQTIYFHDADKRG